MTAFFNNIQIVPGFYPFASLLTSVILWALYRVFIHMKCQSRQAQLFITAGLCFVTASLFLKLTVWVEIQNPEMSKQNANIFVSETPVTPTVPSSFSTPILSPDDKTQKPNYHTVPATALPDEQPALSVPYYYVAQQYLKDNISYLYVTGILLLMIYLILQLSSLEFIRRKSRFKEQRGCIKVYHTPYSTPFSYSYNIFLPTNIELEKQKFVLAHEESHIWHRHFYKLLFLQSVASVNWFNPFVWLLIRSIKELQEMEADKDVLDNGYDREQYQINLVLTCTENKEWILAKSNYNYSSLKSRILFMNKQIKNGRSRIIALTASINFWGVTGFVMAQTAEKNTQNLTHNTEVNITRLTNQTETQSIDSKTAAETSPSSISSESIIQGKPQRYDDRGCWTMVCIGDSAYRTYKYDKPVLHYKFYGKKSTLTICAYDRSNPDFVFFTGATGTYKEKSDSKVLEAGEIRLRKWIDTDQFEDTWKDTYDVSGMKGTWKTERWKRSAPSEELDRVLACFKESEERDDRFKGTWKLKAKRNNRTGVVPPASYDRYKIYGKHRYLSFTLTPRNPKKLFYTFKGDCGTFKTVSPDLIREHQKDIKIKWMDKDNFSITLIVNGQEWYEEWTRVKRPDFFKKILKSTEL